MGTRRLGADGQAQHGEQLSEQNGEQNGEQDAEQNGGHDGERKAGPRNGAGGRQAAGPAAAWVLTAEATAASRARALTRDTLGRWHIGDPADVDDIVLMVDELITNAIVHGSGPVRLRLLLDGPTVTGEVSDDSPVAPRPSGVDPGGLDWSEAGRGLMLVVALASEFGARPAGRGKTVWFTRLLHTPNGHPPPQSPN